MKPNGQVESSIALVCMLLWSTPIPAESVSAEGTESPSMEMLEYLGSWEEGSESLIDPVQLLELIESRLAEAPEEVKNVR